MENRGHTKDNILAKSLELFSQNGYAATSIRQISRAVGIRESAVYNHFKSKNDILKELFTEFGAAKTRDQAFVIQDFKEIEKDPYLFFQSIYTQFMDYFKDENAKRFTKILMMEIFRDPSAREIVRNELFIGVRSMLAQLFEKLMEHNMIKKQDVSLLATEFLAPLFFLNLEHLILDMDEKEVDHIWRLLRGHIEFFWSAVKK